MLSYNINNLNYFYFMKGYTPDLEKITIENNDYRRVLYTSIHMQLVLMSIPVGSQIGEEVHKLDQFIRIEQGEARVLLDKEEHVIGAGQAVIVPQGVKHNVINSGTIDLKLYTIYAPPNHRDGTIHRTKAEADAAESEHRS